MTSDETSIRVHYDQPAFALSAPIPAVRAVQALDILLSGQIDGSHHRLAVIDEAVRMLAGDDYEALIQAYESDGEYSWDAGIPG